mmetsp:Transcript_25178/g.49556  ORF Transcript_25178/g.49556 Transcript_25178/m.49556 type:complete len:228 (+) Transcript_25178:2605-3288(+)
MVLAISFILLPVGVEVADNSTPCVEPDRAGSFDSPPRVVGQSAGVLDVVASRAVQGDYSGAKDPVGGVFFSQSNRVCPRVLLRVRNDLAGNRLHLESARVLVFVPRIYHGTHSPASFISFPPCFVTLCTCLHQTHVLVPHTHPPSRRVLSERLLDEITVFASKHPGSREHHGYSSERAHHLHTTFTFTRAKFAGEGVRCFVRLLNTPARSVFSRVMIPHGSDHRNVS